MNKTILAIFCMMALLILISGCVTENLTSPVKLENGKEQTAGQAAKSGAEKVSEDTEKLKELLGDN
ncbi:MAG: hypothetical protein Q7K42_01240 [Candidatus Diapherotrites archaeon]|nr:hypothetical protein [Candidatus Diapherotrites archaeon]